MSELHIVAEKVLQAQGYQEVFGAYARDDPQLGHNLKKDFRRLVRILHPDRYVVTADRELASSAFQKLQDWHSQAQQAATNGRYGQPLILATVTSRKATHVIHRHIGQGDICTLYRARTTKTGTQDSFCKLAVSATDHDLLETEARALRALHGPDADPKWAVFSPRLLDSLGYREAGKPLRQMNVIEHLEGFYNLARLKAAFPGGFELLHMIWIWRRLLVAIGHAHDNGVVHAAVLPPHVMILPQQHGLSLVDWCYASIRDDGRYPAVRAIVDRYRDWYPAEVLAKQPPGPGTDIAMAARCMIGLMGGDPIHGTMPARIPKPFRAFFKGCLQAQLSARPDDAWRLLKEFDELLEQLGPPYYPRRFRPFALPTGMA